MKNKILTAILMLLTASSPILIIGQNQVSREGFFKSLSMDPVITLHNKSASPINCIIINYKINGGEMQNYRFGGTLPANTSVDIPLPRMQVTNGMHFFDASVTAQNGESLKGKTFAEGLSFTLSPGNKISSGIKNNGNNDEKPQREKSPCDCQNGDGLDEDISFWFNLYINDSHKLDVFGSIDHGKIWFPGKWNEIAGLENKLNTAEFKDPLIKNRIYSLTVSTEPVENYMVNFGLASSVENKYEPNMFKCFAYPNPFSHTVNIQYNITEDASVDMQITDLSGRVLAHPIQQLQHGKGNYTYEYNANNLTPGVYYCIIQSGNIKRTMKIVRK